MGEAREVNPGDVQDISNFESTQPPQTASEGVIGHVQLPVGQSAMRGCVEDVNILL